MKIFGRGKGVISGRKKTIDIYNDKIPVDDAIGWNQIKDYLYSLEERLKNSMDDMLTISDIYSKAVKFSHKIQDFISGEVKYIGQDYGTSSEKLFYSLADKYSGKCEEIVNAAKNRFYQLQNQPTSGEDD